MNLSWKDYLLMHWPYLAMGLLALVGGIYTFGFESGKRSILFAAARATVEANTKPPRIVEAE